MEDACRSSSSTDILIARPGGRSGAPKVSRPPPVTTFVIYVDDTTGKVLEVCVY